MQKATMKIPLSAFICLCLLDVPAQVGDYHDTTMIPFAMQGATIRLRIQPGEYTGYTVMWVASGRRPEAGGVGAGALHLKTCAPWQRQECSRGVLHGDRAACQHALHGVAGRQRCNTTLRAGTASSGRLVATVHSLLLFLSWVQALP